MLKREAKLAKFCCCAFRLLLTLHGAFINVDAYHFHSFLVCFHLVEAPQFLKWRQYDLQNCRKQNTAAPENRININSETSRKFKIGYT